MELSDERPPVGMKIKLIGWGRYSDKSAYYEPKRMSGKSQIVPCPHSKLPKGNICFNGSSLACDADSGLLALDNYNNELCFQYG